MQIMTEQTTLRRIRKELDPFVSQEDMARDSRVTLNTYRNAETGRNTSYSTAQSILSALNGYLRKAGRSEIARVEDLGLSIV